VDLGQKLLNLGIKLWDERRVGLGGGRTRERERERQ